MGAEYYEFIGVAESATNEEIRRACAQTLRRLTVAKDEEGRVRLLNQVRPTLTDSRSRAEYDALQCHGEEIAGLTEEAFAAMDADDWSSAVRLWKQVLVRMSTNEVAMAHLGLALSLNGDHQEAIRVLERLTEFSRDGATCRGHMGMEPPSAVLLEAAGAEDDSGSCQHETARSARRWRNARRWRARTVRGRARERT